MRKSSVMAVFFGLCLFFLSFSSFADENSAPAPSANPIVDDSTNRKLDKIIDTQDQILKQLNEMKAELEIVKIRASQR